MYVLSTGCQWRAIPKDLPPRSTVHGYFDLWSWEGTLDRIHHDLYIKCREAIGHEASPTTAVINSQSVKSAVKGGPTIRRGYDVGKKIKGKKRHIVVDTQGLLIHAIVHAADIQDRDGGELVMATMFGMFPFLLKLYADGGYQGPKFRGALKKIMAQDQRRDRQAFRSGEGFRRPAEAMDRRANFRLARPMPKAREGLGKSQPQSARFPAPRLHQAHVEKAMQSRITSRQTCSVCPMRC